MLAETRNIIPKLNFSSSSGEPDLIPGVKGRLGGHSAWLQVTF